MKNFNRIVVWVLASSLLVSCDKQAAPTPNQAKSFPWEVPLEAQQQENPIRYDVDSVARGRQLFEQHCQRCHGYYGEGNGIVGATLDQKPANLLRLSGKQMEGAFAWKIRQGRDQMPSYREVLSDTDIWHIVNFVASLENEEGSHADDIPSQPVDE